MDQQHHWEQVHTTKPAETTSWYTPHLTTSLDWIQGAAPNHSAAIIDIGAGSSTLIDDLYQSGHRSLTALDIATPALTRIQQRLGPAASQITWLTGDITTIELPQSAYDLWHDRAVFHFLTDPAQRALYLHQLTSALKPNGHVILATFGPNGPRSCSGLPTNRYDAQSLTHELGPDFQLLNATTLTHQTPSGATQEFLYCHFESTKARHPERSAAKSKSRP